jgi:hypothetical protein
VTFPAVFGTTRVSIRGSAGRFLRGPATPTLEQKVYPGVSRVREISVTLRNVAIAVQSSSTVRAFILLKNDLSLAKITAAAVGPAARGL